MTKHIELAENSRGFTHLEVEFYYSLGGYNYFTHRTENRGYYLSVSPVIKSGITERYPAFSGNKMCIKEVKRKSAKAEVEAEKIAENKLENLIGYILNKHGLKLA